MKIIVTRQCWPKDGGAVLSAGRTYDLDPDVVKRLPKDGYKRVGKTKQQKTPANKQLTTSEKK